ncbi:DUF3025 domain-containing protein [Alteromonas sp. a30]|uniref:DUF3025 domain-containing protein n=1 Tax=Alteromonas sp. a30 TaxID=2730917 RepID=UPI00227EB579|nr:DUF3025 domain-containing protein [Alteromonas sp. a30]MCY7297012.1 DUF3025 domain-containing protein [Alteromonas sp. a30]
MKAQINTFPRIEHWQTSHFLSAPFRDLTYIAPMAAQEHWPAVSSLAEFLGIAGQKIQFTAQEQATEVRYYEQIVYEDSVVPTREANWHDFYNACIWRLFSQSKRALNRVHIHEINEFGLKPRTPRRDRVTHFDECGVVLAYSNPSIPSLLAEHEWQAAFVDNRAEWGKTVQAFVFGHANYEMLMQPHIGLTGKWLGVAVDNTFWKADIVRQYQILDEQVLHYIQQDDSFSDRAHFKPLPLLGVPQWCPENHDPLFYQNTDYFRPKRR